LTHPSFAFGIYFQCKPLHFLLCPSFLLLFDLESLKLIELLLQHWLFTVQCLLRFEMQLAIAAAATTVVP
jgi:hypothetical protein